jgi:tetratricopeptide (TPR) repeat protein
MERAKRRTRLIRWAVALLSGLVVAAVAEEARAEEAPTADPMKAARAAYQKRAAMAQAKVAVEQFEAAIGADPSYEALWEGARAVYFLGEYPMSRASRADHLKLYDKGIDWAKRAVAKRPGGADGQFWLGTMYGVWGQANGILKSLSIAGPLREAGEKAMKIDPDVECAGPFRLLGRYYFKVPRIAGGDRQKSLKLLEEGIRRCPGNDLGRFYFAEVLAADGQEDRARANLEHVIGNKSVDPRFRAEYRFVKRWAEKALEDL